MTTKDLESARAQESTKRRRRIHVPKSVRFEVFKRDKFTCQYCGSKAPDVVLHVDHIEAVACGGTSDILNLITACDGCNLGKSDRALSDDSALVKQRTQLVELQARREQISMMVDWRRELLNLNDETASEAAEFWASLVPGFSLNASGEQRLKAWLRKYPVDDVLQAMEVAIDKHAEYREGEPTHDSVEAAWKAIEGIVRFRKLAAKDPDAARLRYIRGIMRNRFSYCPNDVALERLEGAFEAGVSLDQLERIAKRERNWSNWSRTLEQLVAEAQSARAPKAEEGEIAPVQGALFRQLTYLSEELLWEVVGYAKGLALKDAAMRSFETEDENEAEALLASPPEPYSAEIASDEEAVGFADALGLIRSSHRERWLLEMREITHDHVADLVLNRLPYLPVVPYLTYDDDARLLKVAYPCPQPERNAVENTAETPRGCEE